MRTSSPQTVALISLGCPKNLVDSEKILAHLAEGGCVVAAPLDEADVIVVNTCGFLSAARDESLAAIAEAVARKRTGPARRVVVAGCLVDRDAQRLHELAPGIDAVVGVNSRDDILAAVLGEGPASRVEPYRGGIHDDAGRFRLTAPHTAYLRIAEGCSRRCSFCTIPAIRGPFRSKGPETVLAEARELLADGAVELNLIAQDTTAYGRDLGDGVDLVGLLEMLDALDGARWIRLMYAYPRRFTDELIAVMAACRRVVPYVDLPLQHISDPVLRRMGRGVGRAQTEALLAKLRDRLPGVALRTGFIVGFPGETDQQFEELLRFVREFGFDAMGVFEFSPEEGTPAAEMPDPVPPHVKAERAKALMLAQQEVVFAANRAKVGESVEVLIDLPGLASEAEAGGEDAPGGAVGRYCGQAPEVDSVCLLQSPAPAGSFVRGTVAGFDAYDLIVEIAGQDDELEAT